MDLIKRRYIFLGFSGVLVLLSIASLFTFGLKPGIDLLGGTQWQFSIDKDISDSEVRDVLESASDKDVTVKRASDGSFIVRLPSISQKEKQNYEDELIFAFGGINEKNFSNIGPSIGDELRKKSITAIIFVLFGISLYIAFAFRKVSRPISSWKYGIVSLITLFHDVIIPTGILAILGKFSGIEIDTNFIVALLFVMGFSVHDTIVVFDRIRENILISRGKSSSLGDIINKSVNDTLVRSINTSLTLVFILVALLLFGPQSMFYFVLVILIGTLFGTYSSIFVASPLLYEWERIKGRKS